jgi:hypothetical protein
MQRIRDATVDGSFAAASAAFLDRYQAARGQESVSMPNRSVLAAADRAVR